MNEQMVEKAAEMLWRFEFGKHIWPPVGDASWRTAEAFRQAASEVLDAAMPLLDTVEALDALPVGSQFLDRSGVAWGVHDGKRHPRHYRCTTGEWVMSSERMVRLGPVRVIWTPEATS